MYTTLAVSSSSKNRNNRCLAKSAAFVEESHQRANAFSCTSEQQQAEFKARTDNGIAMARAQAAMQRQQQLYFAYNTLTQSISGLANDLSARENLSAQSLTVASDSPLTTQTNQSIDSEIPIETSSNQTDWADNDVVIIDAKTADSNPHLVYLELKNGSKVLEPTVHTIMLSITELFKEPPFPMAVYDLVQKCEDNKYELWPEVDADLKAFGLLDSAGNTLDDVCNVVMSSVTGEGLNMSLSNPCKPKY